jgi:mRNA interferase RelE/StbE
MVYKIQFLEEVVDEHLAQLPTSVLRLIKEAITKRLAIDPLSYGKPLRYNLKGYRRLRVSDYRVVYRIEKASMTVVIIAIKHRKDICNYSATG